MTPFTQALQIIAIGVLKPRRCKTCKQVKHEAEFRPRHYSCRDCENQAKRNKYHQGES